MFRMFSALAALAVAAVPVRSESPVPSSAAAPAGLQVSSFRLFRVPLPLGAAAVSIDGRYLAAAVENAPELAVVALETGTVERRIALSEPASDVVRYGKRIFAVGRRSVTALDAASLKPLGPVDLPLATVTGLAAPADEAVGRVVVVGALRDDRPGTWLVRVNVESLRVEGEPSEIAAQTADAGARPAVSGDGRRVYLSRYTGTTVYDLALGRVVSGELFEHGRVWPDRLGRFVVASDGTVHSADLRHAAGRLSGTMFAAHPSLPLVMGFGLDGAVQRAGLDEVGEFGTVHVYALPNFNKVGEWTAPGTMRGRRPIILPDNRIVIAAASVQATGPAAALLMGGAGLGGAVGPDLEAIGKGLLDAFLGTGPAETKSPGRSPKPSNRLADITDKLYSRPVNGGAVGKPTDDKPGTSTVVRESYVLTAVVGFDKLPVGRRAMFGAQPAVAAVPGGAGELTLPVVTVAGATAGEFTRVAGPPGLSLDPATGRLTYLPRLGDLGTHTVRVRMKDSAGREDHIAFDVDVRLGQTVLRLPPGPRGVSATLELPALAADGKTLVAADVGRRTLYSLPADGAGVREPTATAPTDERIEAVVRHGDKVAVALDGRADVLLVDPSTLTIVGRVSAAGIAPRCLLSTGDRLLVSGPEPGGRGFRTIALDTGVGRPAGEPIPLGGRLTLLPDGRTLIIGGTWQSPDAVLWDMTDRRIIETVSVARIGAKFVPTARAPGGEPGTAGCRGGAAVHPTLPLAVLWGEDAERPSATAAGGPVPARTASSRIVARLQAEADRIRPKVFTVVSVGSGRTIRRFELPLPGRIIDVQFSADGNTLLAFGPDRVYRLPLDPAAIAGDGGVVFASDPPTVADAERTWQYRPCVLPDPAAATVTVVSGPSGLRVSDDGRTLTWTPEAADLGPQAVRLRAALPDGRSADQTFTVEVHPPSIPLTDTRGHWFADPAGEFLVRKVEQRLEIHSMRAGGPPRSIELGGPAGAAAVHGRRAAVAVNGSGRIAFVDLRAARIVGQVSLERGSPRSLAWSDAGELLAATDKGEVRRVDADALADLGRIAYGSLVAVDPAGGRLFTIAPREALPRELAADLLRLFSAPSADGSQPAPRGGITIARDIRPSSYYLLSYRRTADSVALLDAAPLGAMPLAMLVGDRGRSLYLLSDGAISVRSAGDLAAPPRPLAVDGDRPGPTRVIAVGDAVVAVSTAGKFHRLSGTAGNPGAEPLGGITWTPFPPDAYPRPEIRTAAGRSDGPVVLLVGDRAYRLTISPTGNGEHFGPSVGSVPPLLYRAGEIYRYVPVYSPEAGVKPMLRSGPAGAALIDGGAELVWPVPRGHTDLERVVLSFRDADGRETRQAFLLRRERR